MILRFSHPAIEGAIDRRLQPGEAIPFPGAIVLLHPPELESAVEGMAAKCFFVYDHTEAVVEIALIPLPQCPQCGCDELHPCEGGCSWVRLSDGRVLCSKCAEKTGLIPSSSGIIIAGAAP